VPTIWVSDDSAECFSHNSANVCTIETTNRPSYGTAKSPTFGAAFYAAVFRAYQAANDATERSPLGQAVISTICAAVQSAFVAAFSSA
jgi:hypothetical protein